MLLKIERTILKKVSSNMVGSIELSKFGKYSGEDIYQAFLDLKELGFFRNVDVSNDRTVFSYVLSVKGKHYKEYVFLEFLRNILIPFIVALVTATATYHLEKIADSYSSSSTSQSTYELNCTDYERFELIE